VTANPEMIPFALNVGIRDLIVKELCVLRPPGNARTIVVQEPAKEPELFRPIQDLNSHQVSKLANERLHVLFKTCEVLLDVRPNQPSHAVAGELCFERAHRAPRIAEHLGEGRGEASPTSFMRD
jgi:hypothetical protein